MHKGFIAAAGSVVAFFSLATGVRAQDAGKMNYVNPADDPSKPR